MFILKSTHDQKVRLLEDKILLLEEKPKTLKRKFILTFIEDRKVEFEAEHFEFVQEGKEGGIRFKITDANGEKRTIRWFKEIPLEIESIWLNEKENTTKSGN